MEKVKYKWSTAKWSYMDYSLAKDSLTLKIKVHIFYNIVYAYDKKNNIFS